jgi:hypothetical protein
MRPPTSRAPRAAGDAAIGAAGKAARVKNR